MKGQAMGTIEGEVALIADGGGLLLFIIIGARIGLVSVTGPTRGAFAWMVSRVVVVIATVALVAPITLVDEASDGSAPLVMGVGLEQDDFMISVWATVNEEEGMLTRQHFQLVRRIQGREVLLELF